MEATNILIVGGGLAGLTTGLQLLHEGIAVSIIEKNTYPKHKVCGEYVSNEVLGYLNDLGVDPIIAGGAVSISRLQCSSLYGKALEAALPLGGFGISRYQLDYLLYTQFITQGGNFIQDQVTHIDYKSDIFMVKTASGTSYKTSLVVGAHGKRSTLDVSLSRKFIQKKSPWLAVKMHYKVSWEADLVALHNFKGGYCGISQVEDERVNVCYLAHSNSFKKHKNIELFREKVLRKNPYLDRFFAEAEPIFEQALSISQISFDSKKRVENHILMCGDSASLIHPLCGNGMAMAIMGARLLAKNIAYHLKHNTKRSDLEQRYEHQWQAQFNTRLRWGRSLQKLLTSSLASNYGIAMMRYSPWVLKQLIKTTHGKPQNL